MTIFEIFTISRFINKKRLNLLLCVRQKDREREIFKKRFKITTKFELNNIKNSTICKNNFVGVVIVNENYYLHHNRRYRLV